MPIANYYIGGVPFADPAHFPNVDAYAEKGDINQEDITNDAVNAWMAMSCWHFSLTDNPGVNHFELPSNPGVLARLIAAANAAKSNCPAGSR